MSKYCTNCGQLVEESCKYCTECGVLATDKKTFTYNNRTFKEPSLYNHKGISDTAINTDYSKLVKNINASFAIGVGVVVGAVVLMIWLTFFM